jgi:hypothetical protein
LHDSPLEERVWSELVSENRNLPAIREFTGNFIESGLGGALIAAKKGAKPEPYGSIPYASEQGIKSGLAGNQIDPSGNLLASSGNRVAAGIFVSKPGRDALLGRRKAVASANLCKMHHRFRTAPRAAPITFLMGGSNARGR